MLNWDATFAPKKEKESWFDTPDCHLLMQVLLVILGTFLSAFLAAACGATTMGIVLIGIAAFFASAFGAFSIPYKPKR